MKWIAGAAFVTYFILATIALSQNHQTSPSSTMLVIKFPTYQHYATVSSMRYPGGIVTVMIGKLHIIIFNITSVRNPGLDTTQRSYLCCQKKAHQGCL